MVITKQVLNEPWPKDLHLNHKGGKSIAKLNSNLHPYWSKSNNQSANQKSKACAWFPKQSVKNITPQKRQLRMELIRIPSLPIRRASANDFAPTGNIINSCMARLFPAWLPPFITLKAGTGITSSFVPDISWMCLYNGTPFAPAPALHTLRDTPNIALAPNFDLLGVPSISSIFASTSAWFLAKQK